MPEGHLRASFARAIGSTYCPFASKARIRHAEPWLPQAPRTENLSQIKASFRRFRQLALAEQLDGFVAYVDPDRHFADISVLAADVAELVQNLSDGFEIDLRRARELDWEWRFPEDSYFAIVFAGLYPAEHTRHLDTALGYVVMAQPAESFFRNSATSANMRLKKRIRRMFAAAGRTYDGHLIDSTGEADHYVAPLRIGDQPVRWYNQ